MTEERLLAILENFEKGNTDEGVEDCEIEYCKNRHWLVWMSEINDGQKNIYQLSDAGLEKLRRRRR